MPKQKSKGCTNDAKPCIQLHLFCFSLRLCCACEDKKRSLVNNILIIIIGSCNHLPLFSPAFSLANLSHVYTPTLASNCFRVLLFVIFSNCVLLSLRATPTLRLPLFLDVHFKFLSFFVFRTLFPLPLLVHRMFCIPMWILLNFYFDFFLSVFRGPSKSTRRRPARCVRSASKTNRKLRRRTSKFGIKQIKRENDHTVRIRQSESNITLKDKTWKIEYNYKNVHINMPTSTATKNAYYTCTMCMRNQMQWIN